GTQYDGASAKSWRMHNDTGVPYDPTNAPLTSGWLPQYAAYTFPSTKPKVSIGLAMKWGVGWGTGGESYDLLTIQAPNGNYLVLNGYSTTSGGGNLKISAETYAPNLSPTQCY